MPEYSLMKHQKKGVKFLDAHDGVAALLYDPGVGKTGTTLSWVDRQAAKHGDFRVLVVAPKTACDTWVLQAPPFMDSVVKARFLEGRTADILTKIRRANNWMTVPAARVMADHKGNGQPGGRVTILSMSAGAISSWCTDPRHKVQLVQAVRKYAPHLIVVDESQIIKSATSNLSMAMYQLGQLAPHRIILTGTVNPHSALDCYGQWRFLAPWTFSDQYHEAFTKRPTKMTRDQKIAVKPWSWKRFTSRYAVMGGYEGKQIVDTNEDFLPELHARVAERAHVVRKEDALDLPPVTDVDVHVQLDAKEQRIYDEMLTELQVALDSGELLEAPNALAKIMKLRQITAGFMRDTETGDIHVTGTSKQKAVAEIVNTNLAGEKRIVVFAYFRAEVAAIAKMLQQKGRIVESITGDTSSKERLAIRQRFGDVANNPTPTVLVAQARTMSLSVNELVSAQHAVYASMSERRDDWVQSRGRLDRNGQKGSKVTFWNVYCPNLIDDTMLTNHKHRGDMEKALLDYVRNAPRKKR